MTEKKLTAREVLKIVVFTILAVIGFFVLWGISFIYCLALTLNIVLSLFLGLCISAVTISVLITTILMPPRKRSRLVLSKRQKVGAWVGFAIIFALSLPLIIKPPLFLCLLPSLVFALFIMAHDTLRRGREKEVVQK